MTLDTLDALNTGERMEIRRERLRALEDEVGHDDDLFISMLAYEALVRRDNSPAEHDGGLDWFCPIPVLQQRATPFKERLDRALMMQTEMPKGIGRAH